MLRGRKQWFEQIEGPILVLWWIPASTIPTVRDAQERLQHLKDHGPTPHAFTFRTPFAAPDQQVSDVEGLDAAFCEWAAHDPPERP